MTQVQSSSGNIIRIVGYFILFMVLFVLSFYLRGVFLGENVEVYRAIRIAKIPLILCVGIFSWVRYLSGGKMHFFFFAIGFLGSFLLDVFHVLLITSWYSEGSSFYSQAFVEWSFNASTFFLFIFMFVSWLFCGRKCEDDKREKRYLEWSFAGILVFIALTAVFYFLYPLPEVYYVNVIFGGIQELTVSLLALLVLLVYIIRETKHKSTLSGWIVCFLVLFSLGQILFVSSAQNKFDALFNAGHLIKLIAYICISIGFIVDSFSVFKSIEDTRREVEKKDKEIEETKNKSEEIRVKYESKKNEIEKTLLEMERNRNELEKMNEMMVGREIKMIELKKEIARLKNNKS